MEREISNIIVKVLSSEASLEEKQLLMQWLGKDANNMKMLQQTESIWNAVEMVNSKEQYNAGEAFERFKNMAIQRPDVKPVKLSRKLDILWRVAAMVVFITGLAFFFIKPESNEITENETICEIIAPAGSKAQALLPDGTKVWLNADSRIRYRKNFDPALREVILEGEGYFEVSKDVKRPFIVNTSEIRIKALGTAFNVKSYPGDKTIVTTLVEGKVELELKSSDNHHEKTLSLKPNEQAVYFKDDTSLPDQKKIIPAETAKEKKILENSLVLLSEKVNTDNATAWKDNYLYFDNETFVNLAIKLERRFGVTIQIMDDKIGQYPFTGRFDDVIIEQVLAALQFASPFEYTIKGKNIMIYSKSSTN